MSGTEPLYDELAELYDAAFSWDVSDEVAWLVERLGTDARTVLEPACGAARMFLPFAAVGVDLVGIELSEAMIARARVRLERAGRSPAAIVHGDIRAFDLGRTFDGAICPINSIRHLHTEADLAAHLECVAKHLAAGARYMVQADLAEPTSVGGQASVWEVEVDGRRVETRWSTRSFDPVTRIETESCLFTVLDGPGAGSTHEALTKLRRWSFAEWRDLVSASPFTHTACFDGNDAARPPLAVDGTLEGDLLWHELAVDPR